MAMFGKPNLFRDPALELEEERLSETFRGTVAGVHFDLRHPLIDAKKWALPRLITERPAGHPGFHVAPDPSAKNIFRASLAADLDENFLQAARQKGIDVLYVGDRVSVSEAIVVDLTDNDDPFALAPDRQGAQLRLRVTRGSGAREELKPFYIFPRGSNAAPYGGNTLARLADRIESLDRLPLEQINQLRGLVTEIEDLQRKLESAFWGIRRDTGAEAPKGLLGDYNVFLNTMDLRRLVNLAAGFGYRQGGAEASQEMQPLAQRSIERKEQTRAAGRAGRLMSRVDFAMEYWAEHPEARTYQVAKTFLEETEDKKSRIQSVMRSIQPCCPPTSPSYKDKGQ
jgi:hypothetical protein